MEQNYIQLKDFKFQILSGKTSATPDASLKFRHGANQLPSFYMPLEGDVYVAPNGVDQNTIDVRSAKVSEPFKFILFY